MHLCGQMEVLPNVMRMQGKKCTLLYFRGIWIPVILKSKRYYSLLKKIRTISMCHLIDCCPNQVWSSAYKIEFRSLWKYGDFPQFNMVLNYLPLLVKQIINFAHWMKDWTPAMHMHFKQIQTDQKLPACISIENILAIEKKRKDNPLTAPH